MGWRRAGILLAHVFLNLPFALRVLVFQWQSIPDTAWKVSAQLGLSGWQLLWPVTLRSLGFAMAAATLAVVLALGSLELWRLKPRWRGLVEIGALHHLVIPSMVLSVGLYLFFLPHINWLRWGWVAIIGLNALVALPFVYHQLKPKVFDFDANYRRQVASLGLSGWAFWRQVYGPWLSVTLRRAWALAFVLALGDFAIFGIFGQDEWRTLPWLIHALAGSYQLRAAALAALWLLAFALIALWLLEEHRSRA